MRIAVVENGLVDNIIVADDITLLPDGPMYVQLNENSNAEIGATYDGELFVNKKLEINEASSFISKVQFLDKFTFEELVAIETAAESSAPIRVIKQYLDAAAQIDMKSNNTVQFIAAVNSANLITSDRADTILGLM